MTDLLAMLRHELARLFATRRGLLAAVVFLAVWLLLLLTLIDPAIRMVHGESEESIFSVLVKWLASSREGAWPRLDLMPLWLIGLYLFPSFVVVFAADQIAEDRSRGTLRYISQRASRAQIYFSRFVVQMLLVVAMLLFSAIGVLSVFLLRAPGLTAEISAALPLLLLNLFIVLVPYVALMSLLSVVASSARQALLMAVLAWVAAALLGWQFGGTGSAPTVVDFLFPGSQTALLLRLDGTEALQLAWIPLLHTLVFLGAGYVWFNRRDI